MYSVPKLIHCRQIQHHCSSENDRDRSFSNLFVICDELHVGTVIQSGRFEMILGNIGTECLNCNSLLNMDHLGITTDTVTL